MSGDVIAGLVEKARTDSEFRSKAVADLDGTLAEYGFELSEEELAAARDLHAQAAGMTDAELEERLSSDVIGHAG
jgi:hypothetical protein